jgi:hypothetical protein
MNRLVLPSVVLVIAALPFAAAEPASSSAAISSVPSAAAASGAHTLVDLEARVLPPPSDVSYWSAATQLAQDALRLIERNTLATGDEFFRVAKLVAVSDNRFRTDRARYELHLSAAALGHIEAEKQLATGWDRLLTALGRPLRTDFSGLRHKQPDYYQSDPAPGCVQAVLRDPEQARTSAKAAERNAEMKSIVDADQADRRNWSKLTPEEMKATNARDTARNQRTREIIAAGELRTAADFSDASLVMQHSAHFSGYQTAHELAVCAMLLGDRGRGRWLVAATYDRMLGSVGHDQRFGTQYRGMGGVSSLVSVDPTGICDGERKALGCPTLDEARNHTLRQTTASTESNLAATFAGPNRTILDPKFGLTARYPEGWKVRDVRRWGDQQNTVFFELTSDPDPTPSFYYKVYRAPRPMTAATLEAFVREEAEKKQASRRETWPNYTNRTGSFRTFTLGAYPAFSWLADYTTTDGEKAAEYFVRVQTEAADASFFLQSPASKLEPLRPAVDAFMATLKLPILQQ